MYKKYKVESPSQSERGSPHPPSAVSNQQIDRSSHKVQAPPPTPEQPKDVMISYSHSDKKMMNMLKDYLEKNGISVWVDKTGLRAGVDFLSKIGQAIIDAKMFISLLSESTIKSKYCQDELALAYVSNKCIFPVGLETPEVLFPKMNTGMKLQLARFKWNLLIKEEEIEEALKELVCQMKEELTQIDTLSDHDNNVGSHMHMESSGKPQKARPKLKRTKSTFSRDETNKEIEDDRTFWKRNFRDLSTIKWEEFVECFYKEYSHVLDLMYQSDDKEWLIGILRHEMDIRDDNLLTKKQFEDFCTIDGEEQPFWQRVQDQAVESYTVREVFNMDSSVRVDAIQNLGRFHSPAVIEALLDLLEDKDNNVRAVAAISLAKTGAKTRRVINSLLLCLESKDRLVRESGCLALGHLKADQAVHKLVQMWRNDVISHVREAAEVALRQIGGEEAEKAMHMTNVLSEEIRLLTSE